MWSDVTIGPFCVHTMTDLLKVWQQHVIDLNVTVSVFYAALVVCKHQHASVGEEKTAVTTVGH